MPGRKRRKAANEQSLLLPEQDVKGGTKGEIAEKT